jgi:glucose/mannose-6-phosphate isomerase
MNFQKLTAQYDLGNVFGSIESLPQQIFHAWELSNLQLKKVKLKTENLNNILVCGMGGSALGARVIKSLSHETLDLPLNIVNGYHLPDYVNQNTLVILPEYPSNSFFLFRQH